MKLKLNANGRLKINVIQFTHEWVAWYVNGDRHKLDGPAIYDIRGSKMWFVNGMCHREEGPAVIFADGTQLFYTNDIRQYPTSDYVVQLQYGIK